MSQLQFIHTLLFLFAMFSLEFVFSTNIPSFVVQPIVFLAAGVYFYKRRSSLKEN